MAVYIEREPQHVKATLNLVNAFLKDKGIPMIKLEPANPIMYGSGMCTAFGRVPDCQLNSTNLDNLYWAPMPKWWTRSAFRGYMWSSFIRMLWWLATPSTLELMSGGLTPKLMFEVCDKSETSHMLLFEDNIWDIVGPIIKAAPDNVLQTDDPEISELLQREAYQCKLDFENHIHDNSGCADVVEVVQRHNLVPWRPCAFGGGYETRESAHISGANNQLKNAINQAIWKFKQQKAA